MHDVDGVGCAHNWRRHAGAPAAIPDLVDVSSIIVSSLYSVLDNLIESDVRDYGTRRVGGFHIFWAKVARCQYVPFLDVHIGQSSNVRHTLIYVHRSMCLGLLTPDSRQLKLKKQFENF